METTQNGVPVDVQEKFNPLEEPVNEKTYSQPNVRLTNEQLAQDIPEPVYTPPPFEDFDDLPDGENKDKKRKEEKKEKKKEQEPLMPEMNELDDDEKEEAAEQLAETVIDAYEWAKSYGNSMCKISDRRLRKAYADGDIHPDVIIPWTGGESVRFTDFVLEFNETAGETIRIDKNFRKKVQPPLTRIFKKKGAGLSDEARVMWLFSQDMAVTAGMIVQMRRTINDVFEIARAQTEMYRAGTASKTRPQSPPPDAAQQTYTAPPPPPPSGAGPQPYTPPPPPPTDAPVIVMHPEREDFVEPEERPLIHNDPDITMYTEANKNAAGWAPVEKDSSMPTFGEARKLSKMNQVENQEKVRQRRSTKAPRGKVSRKKKGSLLIDEKPAPKSKGRGRPKKNKDILN